MLTTCSAAILVWSPPVFAQDEDADEADEEVSIVVTGSRIRRPDLEANSPIVTLGEEFFQQSSSNAIEDQLNKLPQFTVSQSSTLQNNQGYLAPAAQDIQPNAINTPGAATVSLRGIGANRTLVLVDSRRGAPGNASGAVDVSTIPSAAIQRVEIISGGASATYGADAVAGVTNFILKDNVDDLQLTARTGFSEFGDAFDYEISGIVGADIADGRGNVSFAMSMNTREAAFERDRPWYRDLWNDPNIGSGGFGGNPRPGVNLENLTAGAVASVFGSEYPLDPDNASLTVYGNSDGSLFTLGFESPGVNAFALWPEADASGSWHRTAVGTMAYNNTSNYLSVPTTRYNALARANYELNDWLGVFGAAMFSDSETITRTEASRIQSGWSVDVPWGTGVYLGNDAVPASVIRNGDSYQAPGAFSASPFVDTTPGNLADNPTNPAFQALYASSLACALNPVGGCTNTQAFEQVIPADLQTLLNARERRAAFGDPQYVFGLPADQQPIISQANQPIDLTAMFPNKRETFSNVQTYNLVAGFDGYVPGTDWTWETFINHSVSTTSSRQTGMYSLERVRALYSAPNFGKGFSYRGNPEDNGFGAVTGKCTSGFDVFNSAGDAFDVSQDCRQAIASDVNTKSTMRQTIGEANIQGGLFELPAGTLRFAAGLSYRELEYTFVTDGLTSYGRSFLDQAIGIYPSSNSNAYMDVREVYGELLVPVVDDLPFVESFALELGGRISDYSTTGTSYTFKILGDWEITDWLRIRGGYNRAERAPNLAELFLSPQQSFGVDTVGDLCSTRLPSNASANPETNPNGAQDVKAACLALMTRDNGGTAIPDTDFFSYYGSFYSPLQPNGAGFSFSSAVGNSVFRETIDSGIDPLRPEVADTWTVGVVVRSPMKAGPLSGLNLSVDYFSIKIEDPIGLLSVGAMQQLCLDTAYNPAIAGAAGPDGVAGTADDTAAAAIDNAQCDQVARNSRTGFSTLNSNAMTTTYRNDGLVQLAGIDANLSWNYEVGPGTAFASVNASYMLDFKAKELEPSPLIDYVGTIGTGVKGLNFGGSIEYQVFSTIGYSWGPASLSMQWQHTPPTEDTQEAISPTDDPGYPSRNTFNLNGSYTVNDAIQIRFGIDNLFYKSPRLINVEPNPDASEGELSGGSWNYFDSTSGRRFSLGATVRF